MITIGIIGVVAAISFPTLISKYKEKVYDSQYRKAKNTISNGFNLMMSKNEVTSVSDLPLISLMYGDAFDVSRFKAEFKKYFSILEDCMIIDSSCALSESLPVEYKIPGTDEMSENLWTQIPYIFTTTDGMTFGFDSTTPTNVTMMVDTNSAKNPNTINQDLYLFSVSNFSGLQDITYTLLPEPEPVKECQGRGSHCTMEEVQNYIQNYPDKCPDRYISVDLPGSGYYCL